MGSRSVVSTVIIALVLGMGFQRHQAAFAAPTTVLALDTNANDVQILGAVTGIVYTEVSPTVFSGIDLSGYDVVYVGSAFQNGSVTIPSQSALNALNARTGDIAAFIQAGGGVLALSEPIGVGRYTWLPVAVGVPLTPVHSNDVVVTDPSHPVMDGITSAGLSNWGSSYHTYFTSWSSLDVLASTSSGQPITLAGNYGAGRVVLSTQDADWHYVTGFSGQQLQFVQNSFDWLAQPIPAPGAILLGTLGAGLVGWMRRRRML